MEVVTGQSSKANILADSHCQHVPLMSKPNFKVNCRMMCGPHFIGITHPEAEQYIYRLVVLIYKISLHTTHCYIDFYFPVNRGQSLDCSCLQSHKALCNSTYRSNVRLTFLHLFRPKHRLYFKRDHLGYHVIVGLEACNCHKHCSSIIT